MASAPLEKSKKAVERKAYRFRLEPTCEQRDALARSAGARRFIYNWALARRREYYKAYGVGIPLKQLSQELTQLKTHPQTSWLKDVDSQLLQQALADLTRAYAAFFARRARPPHFKSRKTDRARFRVPQRVRIEAGRLYCPKVGWIRLRQSQEIGPGERLKSATFKRSATGHWDVTLVAEFELPNMSPPPISLGARVVGIDLGLKTFAVLSDGRLIESPRAYRAAQNRLRRAQRALSRAQRGSHNRAKQRVRVACVHERVRNVRQDFLHKTATALVQEYDALIIENLAVKGLARTKLAKSINDAAFGEFRRQLEYKARWQNKRLIVVDRFFPSSKMCGACGALNETLTLSDRAWACAGCGARHDRDLNAAQNIAREGLRLVAVGHTETENACGADVRPLDEADGETPELRLREEARIPLL